MNRRTVSGVIGTLVLAVPAMLAVGSSSAVDDAPLAACAERLMPVSLRAPQRSAETSLEAVLERDFGARRVWGADNMSVRQDETSGRAFLRAEYPPNTSSPSDEQAVGRRGGGGFYTKPEALAGSDHACLAYRVRFAEGFDFVKGGKLPGLYGGEAPSGGRQADGQNGFSLRLMWRAEGEGELYTYLLAPQSDYGVSVGRGSWTFTPGQWTAVEIEAALNAPGQANGVARVWVDGRLVIERDDLVYRSTSELHVDGLMFSTFFGGTGEGWRTPRLQHVDFADFRFYRPAPGSTP